MSVYLPELDALFVHVPRCAGTWVKAALCAADVRVEPATGVGDHNLPENYAGGRFRFCFVRHPATWIESAWMSLHSGWPLPHEARPPLHRAGAFSPFRLLSRYGERDFGDFVRRVMDDQPGFVSRMFEWYVGPPGFPKVEAAGRAESAPSDLTAILRRAGWRGELPDLPPRNAGKGDRPTWLAGLRERFEDSERLAIRRFYGPSPGPYFVE